MELMVLLFVLLVAAALWLERVNRGASDGHGPISIPGESAPTLRRQWWPPTDPAPI